MINVETWRREYNDERPKKSLGEITPTQSSWPERRLLCRKTPKPFATETGVEGTL
ncbi:MAG: integrase core domain-containing protein [Steroidobacteraceae bacterium]